MMGDFSFWIKAGSLTVLCFTIRSGAIGRVLPHLALISEKTQGRARTYPVWWRRDGSTMRSSHVKKKWAQSVGNNRTSRDHLLPSLAVPLPPIGAESSIISVVSRFRFRPTGTTSVQSIWMSLIVVRSNSRAILYDNRWPVVVKVNQWKKQGSPLFAYLPIDAKWYKVFRMKHNIAQRARFTWNTVSRSCMPRSLCIICLITFNHRKA